MTQADFDRVEQRLRIYKGTLARETLPVRPETRKRMADEQMMLDEIRRCWGLLKHRPARTTVQERLENNAKATEEKIAAINSYFGKKTR